MTVAELIKELTTHDQGMEVVTGELGKPEVIRVLDRLVLRQSQWLPAKPQEKECATA